MREAIQHIQDSQLVVFCLDDQRYAVPLTVVERIVRAVAVTPLPHAPAIVLGLVDVAGRVLPVVNLRRRFGLPEREIGPADQFIIARTASRTVVLVVDETHEVIAYPETGIIDAAPIVPGLEHVDGVIALDGGLVLIHALDRCLSLDEERDLAHAMQLETTDGI